MADNGMPQDEPIVALIEDEPLVRDLAACELMELGFKVVEFASADAALPWLQMHGGDLSVLVTDVADARQLDGLELVSILNRLCPCLADAGDLGRASGQPERAPPCVRLRRNRGVPRILPLGWRRWRPAERRRQTAYAGSPRRKSACKVRPREIGRVTSLDASIRGTP